jgi:glycosyltransferase involved in cell wall biosynthesis
MTIRVAFPLIGRGDWAGGLNYLKNTVGLIGRRLQGRAEAWLFLSPAENEVIGEEFAPLVDGRIVVDAAVADAGRGNGVARVLASGRDTAFERVLLEADIDVVFENARFYGRRFAVPALAWIPDLQHRSMPHMFSPLRRLRRELGFQMQIGSGRTLMVSSETAKADLERYYPAARGRVRVVRFAVESDIARIVEQAPAVRAQHGLPDRFFFLPNQFWAHKNHAAALEALQILAGQGQLSETPPIIMTGPPSDNRNPGHFEQLFAKARAAGVESHFRYLGLLPYGEVLALNAACERMINPSLFEGWSTPIEEAKAFATPLILSDLDIHREQAPDAQFFDPMSPSAFAQVLLEAARTPPGARASPADRAAAQEARLDGHAAAILGALESASRRAKTAVEAA